MICKHILLITFLNEPGLIFFLQTVNYSIHLYSFVCTVKLFQVLLYITNN